MMARLREALAYRMWWLRRRVAKARFDRVSRGVLHTPPLRLRPAPLTVVSMVNSRDLHMYLLAIKSFYRHLPGGRVTVLDDGTLTEADHQVLRSHIEGVQVARIDAVPLGPCPSGGAWERLMYIMDASADDYVIQMDSDVLTIGAVPEIHRCVAENRSFTLGSGAEFRIVTLEEAGQAMAGADRSQLQFHAESLLPALPTGLGQLYVRGSAGFTGFGRGAITRQHAEAFSAAMQALMGARWSEWGTEQVTSNFLIANSQGAEVLPWHRYNCYFGTPLSAETALIHFIGTWRFEAGVYQAKAAEVLASLAAAR